MLGIGEDFYLLIVKVIVTLVDREDLLFDLNAKKRSFFIAASKVHTYVQTLATCLVYLGLSVLQILQCIVL